MVNKKRNITYEVLVKQGNRWEIHARYPKKKKSTAITDAKSLEALSTVNEVKVVLDSYDAKEGKSVEITVYPKKKRKTESPAPFSSNRDKAKKTAAIDESGAPPPKKGRKLSTGPSLFIKFTLATVFSLVIALIVTGMALPFLRDLPFGVTARTVTTFVIFIIFFLFFAATLVKSILAREAGTSSLRPKHPSRTGPRTKAQAKHEEKTAKEDELSPAAVTRNLLQSAVDQGIKLKPDDYLGNTLDKTKPLPADAAKHQTFMLSFLERSLQVVKSGPEGMDSFNKFGVNLYLAGACESLQKSFKLDLRLTLQILDECVQIMGFTKKQAQTFADKYEEYLMADVRYMRMFQAGGNAMAAVAGGDEKALKNMAPALKDWNARKAQEEKKGPTTVMFTDMVGSTALTQTRGDAVAQQVVRAHNNIVRNSLTLFNGKEIKHTGDGIMASFSNTSNGVEAGAHIQMKVAAHNQDNPELPLHIKIGINAGEPIAEDDDLFGTTVQLTARIVDRAKSEQVFVSETVHGICAGKEFRFTNRGPHAMKGFKEEVTLYELIWDENAAAADMAPEKPAAAEEAIEKADKTEDKAENEAEQPAETEEAAENEAEQPAETAPATTDAPAGDSAAPSQAAVPEQDGKTDISPTGSPVAAVAAPQQAATETPASPARQSKVDKQAAAIQPTAGTQASATKPAQPAAIQPTAGTQASATKPAQPAAAGKEGKTP